MTPSEIKPEMIFGNWQVIKFDHNNEHRIKYFLCKCKVCGTYRPVRGTALIAGTSTACSSACKNNLLGQKFGKWTVISQDRSRSGYWNCVCECGTKKSVCGSTLKNGTSKSCGCYKIKQIKTKNEQQASSYIGQKIGKLTIQNIFLKQNRYWFHCKCDCGSEIDVKKTNLLNGYVISCGCINSVANEQMAILLTKKGIPFKREYKFEDCCDKRPLPFDFALFNKEDELIGLIENNGEQHYSARGTGWFTPDRVEWIQKHDYIKQKFAEDNKIPLLIIPYQYFDELEKFLITSDFWKIIIKNFND